MGPGQIFVVIFPAFRYNIIIKERKDSSLPLFVFHHHNAGGVP